MSTGNCHGWLASESYLHSSPRYNRSTRIDFVCPGPNDHNNELQLVQEAANCQYQFIWKTQLACSNEPAVVSGSGCSVTDPVTNTVLDFSSIAGQSFPVHVQQGTSYYVYVFACRLFQTNLLTNAVPPLVITCQHVIDLPTCLVMIRQPWRVKSWQTVPSQRIALAVVSIARKVLGRLLPDKLSWLTRFRVSCKMQPICAQAHLLVSHWSHALIAKVRTRYAVSRPCFQSNYRPRVSLRRDCRERSPRIYQRDRHVHVSSLSQFRFDSGPI